MPRSSAGANFAFAGIASAVAGGLYYLECNEQERKNINKGAKKAADSVSNYTVSAFSWLAGGLSSKKSSEKKTKSKKKAPKVKKSSSKDIRKKADEELQTRKKVRATVKKSQPTPKAEKPKTVKKVLVSEDSQSSADAKVYRLLRQASNSRSFSRRLETMPSDLSLTQTISVRPITEEERFDGVSQKPGFVSRIESGDSRGSTSSSTSYRRRIFRPKVPRGNSNITLVIEEVIAEETEENFPPSKDAISDMSSEKDLLSLPEEDESDYEDEEYDEDEL
jgi:hypothetical protein